MRQVLECINEKTKSDCVTLICFSARSYYLKIINCAIQQLELLLAKQTSLKQIEEFQS